MRRAVYLDRDGVLNRSILRNGKPYPPASLDQFEILPGVPEAVEKLRSAGFLTIVITNQPDVATGLQDRAVVNAMHAHLRQSVPVDDIKICLCVEGPECSCYKPKPEMLQEAARDWNIDLSKSFVVGDRWRDIGAGKAAGCRTFFIDLGYKEDLKDDPDFKVRDLPHATELILQITTEADRPSH
jgi:D-glycero-D-manno-heptose 1,7-bisphosphate phosphatase